MALFVVVNPVVGIFFCMIIGLPTATVASPGASSPEILQLRAEIFHLKTEVQNLRTTVTKLSTQHALTSNKTYAFYAYSTRTQYLNNQQPFVFDYVETNIGLCYNTSSGKFTAPVRGLYYFAGNIMAEPGHYIHIEIVVNGRRVSSIFANKGGFAFNNENGSAVINLILERGDQVWVRQEANYEDQAAVSNKYTMFSGFLISQYM